MRWEGCSRDDPPHCCDDPLAELVLRLAGLPAVPRLVPRLSPIRVALLDLRPGEALPLADVDLAQLAQRDNVGAEARRDDLRCLARPREVARVDELDRLAGELGRERVRLLASRLVERRVGVALEAPLAVPVRLAVPHEEQLRHRRLG